MKKKYWWCKKCRCFPDNIVEEGIVRTWRVWDGECYEGTETKYIGDNLVSYCGECDTKLIEK